MLIKIAIVQLACHLDKKKLDGGRIAPNSMQANAGALALLFGAVNLMLL